MAMQFTVADPEMTRREIHRAVAERSVVRIRHYGGRAPGAVLEIRPIAVIRNSVLAEDGWRDRPRLFRLSRIAVVANETPVTYFPAFNAPQTRSRPTTTQWATAAVSILGLMIVAILMGQALASAP